MQDENTAVLDALDEVLCGGDWLGDTVLGEVESEAASSEEIESIISTHDEE